jgi:hypothetical protein
MEGWVGGWKDGRMGGWKNDECMVRWVEKYVYIYIYIYVQAYYLDNRCSVVSRPDCFTA